MALTATSSAAVRAPLEGTTTFIIGRHGKTSMNAQGKICGCGSDPELTKEGLKEAAELGRVLKDNCSDLYEVAYCSSKERCRVTAHIALPIVFDKTKAWFFQKNELREIDHGESEGLDSKERDKIWKKYVEDHIKTRPNDAFDPFLKWKITPFNGAETFEALQKRVSEILVIMAEIYLDKKIVIIAHDAVMQGLIMRSLYLQTNLQKGDDGFYPMFFEANLIPNCGVAVFECNPSLQESEDRIKFLEMLEPKKS